MAIRQTGLGRFLPPALRRVIDTRRRADASRQGNDLYSERAQLAAPYLRGQGIEIGALNAPLTVPKSAQVRYVDVMTAEEALGFYTAEDGSPISSIGEAPTSYAPVDIVDNGETLATFTESSQNFIIANHFIEHCQDPIGTILRHFQVLRPGGILYMAVPDKRYTFDLPRPVTTLAHHLRDYEEGPGWSRREHYEEYFRLVEGRDGEDLEKVVAEQMALPGGHTHYHVWTQREFLALLLHIRSLVGFDILAALSHANEFVCVLRKL